MAWGTAAESGVYESSFNGPVNLSLVGWVMTSLAGRGSLAGTTPTIVQPQLKYLIQRERNNNCITHLVPIIWVYWEFRSADIYILSFLKFGLIHS